MLHEARNIPSLDNSLVREGLQELQRRLPPGWSAGELVLEPRLAFVDATLQITSPDKRTGSISLEVRARLEPKAVRALADSLRELQTRGTFVVLSRYLSESTRSLLKKSGIGYLDLTGNARIVVPKPGLYIETQGAAEDPDREERPARSLRGAKAGRVVRTLIDREVPPGVREIGTLTKIDAGYISRVLAFLDTEALITRIGRGRMRSVDWPALLRRWAQQAPLESRGQVQTYLDPRGLDALVARLAKSERQYAVTGSLAAATIAPIAPARLATVWIHDTAEAAVNLALRPADAGANVLLVEPGDDWIFEGATQRDGVRYAAPSQVAADLLTSPGRGPAEGEELITWMLANEEKWRR